MMLSIIPDVDIISPVTHRGPTHSIVVALLLFAPAFAIYRKAALPYFAALVQHSLIGDYFGGGGTTLLWPLSQRTFGIRLDIKGYTSIAMELLVFFTALALLAYTRNYKQFLRPKLSNLTLAIPAATMAIPIFLAFPMHVPLLMILPHLVYLMLYLTSALVTLTAVLRLRQRFTLLSTA